MFRIFRLLEREAAKILHRMKDDWSIALIIWFLVLLVGAAFFLVIGQVYIAELAADFAFFILVAAVVLKLLRVRVIKRTGVVFE
jgi:hypothetical protein